MGSNVRSARMCGSVGGEERLFPPHAQTEPHARRGAQQRSAARREAPDPHNWVHIEFPRRPASAGARARDSTGEWDSGRRGAPCIGWGENKKERGGNACRPHGTTGMRRQCSARDSDCQTPQHWWQCCRTARSNVSSSAILIAAKGGSRLGRAGAFRCYPAQMLPVMAGMAPIESPAPDGACALPRLPRELPRLCDLVCSTCPGDPGCLKVGLPCRLSLGPSDTGETGFARPPVVDLCGICRDIRAGDDDPPVTARGMPPACGSPGCAYTMIEDPLSWRRGGGIRPCDWLALDAARMD